MAKVKISFPVYSLRKIETPFDRVPGYRSYLAVIEVSDLPDLSKWRTINVRDPKLTGSLPREIRDSFLENLSTFAFLNRGLVIAVDSVSFDNQTSQLTITMANELLHGLLDGGHTYEIIKQNRSLLATDGHKQFIKVELIEGFDSDELVKLVDARNSSNQVKDESLMNLAGDFDKIKTVLKDETYADLIAYKEHEINDDGGSKPIDIREIISLLMAMDRENFNSTVHPINSYRSKAACLKHFEKNKAAFNKIYPLTKDILRLWDAIHLRLPELYNTVRRERGGVSGGKFGNLTGVVHLQNGAKGVPLYFSNQESRYIIPTGFKYPMLGAFRALLQSKGKRYVWSKNIDPVSLLDGELGKSLANTIGEFALEAQNPSKTGKSPLVWQSCYQCAELAYLRMK